MTNPTIMTKTQYAKHRGVSRQMIGKLAKDDRILLTADGMIDCELSDVLLDNFSDTSLKNQHTQTRDGIMTQLSDIGSYSEQRALLTQYKAGLAKIELDKASGAVVDTAVVQYAAFDTARRVRDSILNLPDRLAPLLAAESDVHTARTLLDTELRRALDELHNEFLLDTSVGGNA